MPASCRCHNSVEFCRIQNRSKSPKIAENGGIPDIFCLSTVVSGEGQCHNSVKTAAKLRHVSGTLLSELCRECAFLHIIIRNIRNIRSVSATRPRRPAGLQHAHPAQRGLRRERKKGREKKFFLFCRERRYAGTTDGRKYGKITSYIGKSGNFLRLPLYNSGKMCYTGSIQAGRKKEINDGYD